MSSWDMCIPIHFWENFAKEGTYQVALYSRDAAGNEVSSTLKDKDAGLHFIIDNTPPQIVMDGIEAGGIYDASQKKVNVMFSDNGMLTEARLSLHNDKGEGNQQLGLYGAGDSRGTADAGNCRIWRRPEIPVPCGGCSRK